MTPRPLNIPSNNPILAKQREHSTCIQPLTTLSYPKSRSRLQKPQPTPEIPQACAHNHTSEIRPLIPKLFRRRSGKSTSGMSSQNSTSFEISRDASIEDLSQTMVAVPYVDLKIFVGQETIDYNKQAEVWVCVEATVKGGDNVPGVVVIPSMRFCWKAVEPCDILEIVGEKSIKELKSEQVCQLFLRMHVPKLRDPAKSNMHQWSHEELFEHLESMLGVHEQECLQVEVKYRYPNVPSDNVMTVKQVCKIKRPKTDCAWSMSGAKCVLEGAKQDEGVEMQNRMAKLRAIQNTLPPKSPARQMSSPMPMRSPARGVSSPRPQQPEVIISQVSDTNDTARQLWHDLKRTSLSSQQLVEMSPQRVEELTANDASLKARRQQALANKRSVGAETLRQWKWEDKVKVGEGEMPWL